MTIKRPACNFWLGRAGSGKTYGCLSAIAEELKHSPRGCPLILLTPEQSTAQMERRLAAWPGLLGGFTRARVFSFNHLAREAFAQTGGRPRRQIGELGRIMLLRQAIERRRRELAVFADSAGQAGVAESLSNAILEFQRYGWRPQTLEAWLAANRSKEGDETLLVRKISDLTLLWKDYEAALAAGGWEDPARMYEAAAAAVRRWEWLRGARVWVDGFASFTAQETSLLEALLAQGESAVIALCADPEQIELKLSGRPPVRPRIGIERLFENVVETYEMLRKRFEELGWEVSFKKLPAPEQPTRFSASPPLAYLESRILGRINPGPCPDEVWNASPPSGNGSLLPPIELIETSDRRSEVEAVARRIVSLCRREENSTQPTLTWREIAVLTRDLGPYEAHFREVFTLFDIPFFLDRPRQMEGHPLARLILSGLAALGSGWAGDAALTHLKCGLCGLQDEDAIARIENFIRSIDLYGSAWTRAIEKEGALAEQWAKAEKPLKRLESGLKTGLSPARALWTFLEDVQAAATLDEWIREAREAGEEETVQLHEQAWEQTVNWLEEFETLTAGLPEWFAGSEAGLSFRERTQRLIEGVESALSSTRARLTPPTLNQVTVGSVDRSRTPEIKALYVLGLNDGEFPKNWLPDAVLGDEERDSLAGGGRGLGPDSVRKRLQEHFLVYVALTRPAERLGLTRPMVDDEGKVRDPSPTFALAARCFPRAPSRIIRRAGQQDDPALPLRPEEWALRLSLALGKMEDPGRGSALVSAVAAGALLGHPHLTGPQRRGLELARATLLAPRPAALEKGLALAYWRGQVSLPVTALEMFGECPFKFFARQMLRLSRRLEAKLNVMDLGTIRHDIMEMLFKELRKEDGLAWGSVQPARADELIDRHLEHLKRQPQWGARLEASALGGLTLDEIGNELKLFVRALQFAGRRCALIQTAAEWEFGADRELVIQTGAVSFSIRGKVDRIDALPQNAFKQSLLQAAQDDSFQPCILIDYKSGARRLDLAKTMGGIDLQLLTYALAYKRAQEKNGRKGVRIGGIFYWPLAAPIRDAQPQEPVSAPPVDESWFKDRGPLGMFERDLAGHLDTQAGPGDAAPVFRFRLTKDGAISNQGQNHWPEGSLDRLLEYEERLLTRWAGMMADGEIGVKPYRQGKATACDLCDYPGICRRADPLVVSYRRIDSIKRDEALAMLNSAGEGSRIR